MRLTEFEHDLTQQLDRVQPSLLFQGATPEELTEWQERFRSVLRSLLGLQPERAEPMLRFENETDEGSYVRHRVQYQSEPDVWVPAYLLVPKSAAAGPLRPAVLCLHGHGHFGKDSVVGMTDTPERAAEVSKLRYDFGRRLVEDGYVVLAPDHRGFGERRPGYPGPHVDYCARNFFAAAALGSTVVALQLCDLTRALDVLQSLPFVDGERLGCAGLSYGGRMTMLLSAFDQRIKACVPSGCLNLFQERYQALSKNPCGAQLIPGLLRYGDTPEIFSLVAPRPMVIEWGLSDGLIKHDWAERGLVRIRRAYAAAGVPERLTIDRFEGGHEFNGGIALDVLRQSLHGSMVGA